MKYTNDELKTTLEQLRQRKIAVKEAAEKLLISPRTVQRLLIRHEVERVPPAYKKIEAERAVRRQKREKLRLQVIKSAKGPKQIAEELDIPIRTVFRWRAE